MIILCFIYLKKKKKIIYNKNNHTFEVINSIIQKFFQIDHNYKLILKTKNNKINWDKSIIFNNHINLYKEKKDKNTIEIKIKKIINSKLDSTNASFKSIENNNFLVSKKKFINILNDSILKIFSKKDVRYRNIIHKNKKCFKCKKLEIRGVRYKCIICKEYNLCEDCELNYKHKKGHNFIRIVDNSYNFNFNLDINYDNFKEENLISNDNNLNEELEKLEIEEIKKNVDNKKLNKLNFKDFNINETVIFSQNFKRK